MSSFFRWILFLGLATCPISLLEGGVDQEYLPQMEVEGWVLCSDQIRELFIDGSPPPIQRTNREIGHHQQFYVLKIRNRGHKLASGKLRWALILEGGEEWMPSTLTFHLPPNSPVSDEYYVLAGGLLALQLNDKHPQFKFEWICLKTKMEP